MTRSLGLMLLFFKMEYNGGIPGYLIIIISGVVTLLKFFPEGIWRVYYRLLSSCGIGIGIEPGPYCVVARSVNH